MSASPYFSSRNVNWVLTEINCWDAHVGNSFAAFDWHDRAPSNWTYDLCKQRRQAHFHTCLLRGLIRVFEACWVKFCTVKGITARLFCAAWWKTFLLWQCYPTKKRRYSLFLIFSRATDKKRWRQTETRMSVTTLAAGQVISHPLLFFLTQGSEPKRSKSPALPFHLDHPILFVSFTSCIPSSLSLSSCVLLSLPENKPTNTS